VSHIFGPDIADGCWVGFDGLQQQRDVLVGNRFDLTLNEGQAQQAAVIGRIRHGNDILQKYFLDAGIGFIEHRP
jgi:hypothetical protein